MVTDDDSYKGVCKVFYCVRFSVRCEVGILCELVNHDQDAVVCSVGDRFLGFG